MSDLIALVGTIVDHEGATPLEGARITATPSQRVTQTSDGEEALSDASATTDETGAFSLALVYAEGLRYTIVYRAGGERLMRGVLDCDSYAAGATVDVSSLPPVVGPPPSRYDEFVRWAIAYFNEIGSSASAEGIQDVVGAMIVAAGGTYDDEAGTITLPSSGGGTGTVDVSLEVEGTGYPARSDAPLVIWRGWTDPTADPEFVTNVDLWAQADSPSAGPQTTWFTDFSTDTVGSPPEGWTSRWAAGATLNIIDDGGTNILRFTRVGGTTVARSLVSWDAVPASADVEIVTKVRVPTLFTGTATLFYLAAVRASGTESSHTAYEAHFGNNGDGGATTQKTSLNRRIANAGIYLGLNVLPDSYNDLGWNWVRLRANGSTISMRSWADGEAEPSVWDITATDTGITEAGWVGLLNYVRPTQDFACVGVGIDGATAPTAAE